MVNFSEPVALTFIFKTIAVILVLVAIGIFAVKKLKKS
jgi:flagellar biogenesis protein FliO